MKKITLFLVMVLFALRIFGQSGLTVITPNGGENWVTGCPALIQWTLPAAAMPVKIELFRDTAYCLTILNLSPAGMTSFSWVPPFNLLPGNNFKVKISSLSTTSPPVFDFSDNFFSINPGTITVVSPNGGESWVKGTMHPIHWNDNVCTNVRIELWKGGVFHSIIATSVPSNGTFNWNIPNVNSLVPGNDYRVKILALYNAVTTNTLIADISDNDFSILQLSNPSPITLITPNGGENWITGCPAFIQWITLTTSLPPVKLELYKDNAYLLTICHQTPGGTNSFTWIPPFNLVPGNTFKVKVTVLTSTIPAVDFSDNFFSINPGTITVVSPNGGETWVKGTMHPVIWNANLCSNVRIELWKGGVFNVVIANSVPSNVPFHWLIPNTATLVPGNDYKIKVMSLGATPASTLQVFDFSDNFFSILPGQNTSPVVLITPNGGENWIMGCQFPVQWITTVAPAPPVKLELFKNDLFCMTICPQVPAGQTFFNWIPPYSLMPGNDYKVKVSLLTSTGGFDFSNNNFSINRGNITVVSPNGGETWVKGTMHPILWNDNICENVRIELWKGNLFNMVIAISVPSTGVFNWMVPNVNTLIPGGDYRIKVMSAANVTTSNGMIFDFSDNFFAIAGAPGSITVPAGSIRVHPNPFTDYVRVTFAETIEQPAILEIIDNNGNVVTSRQVNSIRAAEMIELNTSGMHRGAYLLVVRQGTFILTRQHILLAR